MIEGVFLGTASAFPTAERNHPAVYLSLNGAKVLFDCGEGTQRQIRKAGLSPSIDYMFITHWHGDHSLGIGGIIQSLNMMKSTRALNVFGPTGTNASMDKILQTYKFYNHINIKVKSITADTQRSIVKINDYEVYAMNVEHSVKCLSYKIMEKDTRNIYADKLKEYGIKPGKFLNKLKEGKDAVYNGMKLKYKDLTYIKKGKSVAYVTDLKYNKKIINFIKGVETLIIESTFASDFDKAGEFFHLNLKEAMDIANKSKVSNVYFVHTSQRYTKDNLLKEAADLYKKMKCTFKYSFPDDFDKLEV